MTTTTASNDQRAIETISKGAKSQQQQKTHRWVSQCSMSSFFLEVFVNCRLAVTRLETGIPSKEKAIIRGREASGAFDNIIEKRKKGRMPEIVNIKKNLSEYWSYWAIIMTCED